jgi:hypothetical protein
MYKLKNLIDSVCKVQVRIYNKKSEFSLEEDFSGLFPGAKRILMICPASPKLTNGQAHVISGVT